MLWIGRPYGCGSWLLEDKKANMWHGTEKCCGLSACLPPLVGRNWFLINQFFVLTVDVTSRQETSRNFRLAHPTFLSFWKPNSQGYLLKGVTDNVW